MTRHLELHNLRRHKVPAAAATRRRLGRSSEFQDYLDVRCVQQEERAGWGPPARPTGDPPQNTATTPGHGRGRSHRTSRRSSRLNQQYYPLPQISGGGWGLFFTDLPPERRSSIHVIACRFWVRLYNSYRVILGGGGHPVSAALSVTRKAGYHYLMTLRGDAMSRAPPCYSPRRCFMTA